ncbi:hypothetical protein Zmor_015059 [Zophobas morio]|uniref:Uncharacterized protein n=1 Tax=Zophobas morio TaxID=2755281 RepID=A0AA38IG30_9CUCU|nr:hypothetical protein Zmor_015059 [Zophobas morio]
MSNYKCTCKVAEEHKLVCCCVCKKSFKIECVGLSTAEARKIHAGDGLTWSCNNCRKLGNDINSLKAVIISLQEQISTFQSAVTPSRLTELMSIEKSVYEFEERQKRANNLMVFGIKEGENLVKKEQTEKDVIFLKNMFSTVGVSVCENEISPMRCGKYDQGASLCRPVKVKLSSPDVVKKLVYDSRKLRDNEDFKNIRISTDRTPMQLELYREVKTELASRLDSGETNLTIKYIRGVPIVVMKNQPEN